ncbi:unnamed protein product [Owenia fusiformis]|uniref:DNA topoisomerase 2 n=1 Tax=Owenia fusiformis TaxID=6347 RepID=A0A8J1TW49_OWEFU|nr:unnamed protein product [Owenia fusiformis]
MDIENLPSPGAPSGAKSDKRLSVERIYQKKSQLEHILLRPDTYIGSVETVTQPMWVFDNEENSMVSREITYVPGLYKIFDEILVNAADNKQRDPKMTIIKVDIDPENNQIKIWNNGKGIPVVEHKTEKMFVPTLIFGHLLTSSNYNDDQKKVTGGRNGYGAKLCNIFSTKFTVETQAGDYKKHFKQSWANNMAKAGEPRINSAPKGEDFTCITFKPDLEKFKMEKLDPDTVDLFTRRAYDIAASTKGVRVILNGKKLPVKNFKDYIDLYVKNKTDENNSPLKVVYENVNERWEVAVCMSEKGFQQVSFVNSIATTKGGRHVDHVADQVVSKLIEVVKKKNKGGIQIKPFQVKNHLWVFVNALIENPTFDSQTKENMTLQQKGFGSKCSLQDKFIAQVNKCGIVESIMSWMKFKAQEKMNTKCTSKKQNKLKGIPKLDDANDAGTKNSIDCTLILTEGDSAKTLAVAGLGVVGRDRYGVFPLRGKVLNVREATHKQIMENAEINNIIKIMGLQYKQKYDTYDSLRTLRYGKLMIMTDQDQDGSHIKGLLINFIHHNWPQLLKQPFLEEFITPIVKVSKGRSEEQSFYSLPEFEEWKKDTPNWHTYKVKYYKGLGTSTSKEAKEYFSEMTRHRIKFKYTGTEDDSAVDLAFSKKKIDQRKEWLTNWMEERKRRAQLGMPDVYLYGLNTSRISFQEFINKELILFSNMDNERSIPCMVDGFKPGQRKVMFACFKRNLIKELKVAQLAGSVAEQSAYHHGEQSLMGTIIGLAQNFVGSNNVNLLQPIGQFGTRLHGGKDAASPRYIFTALSPLARLLFMASDEPTLKSLYDDNQKIEPEWYCPIIPMVLVNGAEGIGTGWSTKIPNYDVREIVANIKRMMEGDEPLPMVPAFKDFKGVIEELDPIRYVVHGEINIVDDVTVEILELPIRTWTQNYKESVLEPMLQGTEKVPAVIQDYKEYHTDTTVKFIVKMAADKLAQAEHQGLHKFFKLTTTISTNSMVLFDQNGCIRRYDNVVDILKEFYELRLDRYQIRKDYMEGSLAAESLKLDNQARFIMEKIEGTIKIENVPKKEIVQMLVRRGYDPDPVKAWKEAQNKLDEIEDNDLDENESQSATKGGPDFNYILQMALWCLTKEKKDELLKQRDNKAQELRVLRDKTPKDLWMEDLDNFSKELVVIEEQQKAEEAASLAGLKVPKGTKGGRAKPKKFAIEQTMASPYGRRVVPIIDSNLRQKGEKEAIRKQKKKDKTVKTGDDLFNGLDDDDDKSDTKSMVSLADRIGGSPKLLEEAKKAKKQTSIKDAFKKAEPKKPKSPKKSPKGKKKGGKKRNPWSSDEDISDGLSDSDDEEDMVVIPREKAAGARKAATAKKTYNYDSDSASDDEDDLLPNKAADKDSDSDGPKYDHISSDDESFHVAPKKQAPKKAAMDFSDSEDSSPKNAAPVSDSDDSYKEPPKKEPAKKKTLGKKVTAVGDKKSKAADPKQPSIFAAMSKSKPKPVESSQSTNGTKSDSEPEGPDDLWARISKPKDDKPLAAKPAPKAKKPKLDSDIDISDFSDDDKPAPKKAAPKKPAATKKPKSNDEPKPKKKAAPKKRPKKMDSDDSDDFAPKKKSSAAAAKKKRKADSESESDFDGSDDMDIVPVVPRGGGRARAAVKYNFDDSDGDSDF